MKIESDNGVVKLIQGDREQSVWRKDNPDYLMHSYIRTIAVASLTWGGFIAKHKGRALIIGLGGGILCKFLSRYFPHLTIEVIEPNKRVVDLAKQYFDLDHRVFVHATDGRSYMSGRTGLFDMIILDAFDKTYIPADLMTSEFLHEVKKRLHPEGLFIANTWVLKDLTPHESATYRSVFEPVWDFRKIPNTDGNRIILFNPSTARRIDDLTALVNDRTKYADARDEVNPTDAKRKSAYSDVASKLRIQQIETGRTGTILTDVNIKALRADASFD